MFKLVIADDEGKTTTVPLVREEITIGRKEGNTIRLTDRNVSRRHARLQKQNGHYLLQDLGSYNGIVINGARLADARPLKHGDQILIGDYKLAISEEATTQVAIPPPAGMPSLNGASETMPEAPAATDGAGQIHPAQTAPGIPSAKVSNGVAAPPAVPQPPAAAGVFQQSVPARISGPPAPPVATPGAAPPVSTSAATLPPPADLPEDLRQLRLVFLSPAGVPPPVVLERLPLILGRSEAADIALPFPSISREHARLFSEDGQLMIEDLGSSNGILINGEKLPRTRITPGDLVTLGVVEFRVARRGDSTMVVQREAEAVKVAASRRSPVPVIAGVLGGGALLGVIVFGWMRSNGSGHGETQPAVISPAPVVATPSAPPSTPIVAAVTPTPPAPVPGAPDSPAMHAPPTIEVAPPTPPAPTVVAVAPTHTSSHGASSSTHASVRHAVDSSTNTGSSQTVASAYVPPVAPTPPPTHTTNNATATTSNPNVATTATPSVTATAPESPMATAQAAMRHGDNAGVVHALEGHTTTEPEIGLLAITYRQMGNRPAAERTMRRYLARFPNGPRSPSFHDYLDAE